jgi:hypothetical protein
MRLQLPVLFAARLGQIVGVIFRPNDDRLHLVVSKAFENVTLKGCTASLMALYEMAIDPDGGIVIDGAKVQQ